MAKLIHHRRIVGSTNLELLRSWILWMHSNDIKIHQAEAELRSISQHGLGKKRRRYTWPIIKFSGKSAVIFTDFFMRRRLIKLYFSLIRNVNDPNLKGKFIAEQENRLHGSH